MTTEEALDFTIEMINAGKTGIEEAFDPQADDRYYRGYNQGYMAGLQSALDIIDRHRRYFPKSAIAPGHYYTDPTCRDCGRALTTLDVSAGRTACGECEDGDAG